MEQRNEIALVNVCVCVQEAIQLDGEVLFGLVKRTSPAIYKHLVSNSFSTNTSTVFIFSIYLQLASVLLLFGIFVSYCNKSVAYFKHMILQMNVSIQQF